MKYATVRFPVKDLLVLHAFLVFCDGRKRFTKLLRPHIRPVAIKILKKKKG